MRLKDDNKKHAIYQSAMALVTEQGLAGASMSKIAKLAKVSPSTIYTYFDSKEDMLNKLYVMASEQTIAVFQQVESEGKLTYGLYHQWIQSFFDFMVANPVIYSFKEQFFNSPQVSDELRNQQMAEYQNLFTLFEQAIAEREIRDMSMPIVASLLFAPFKTLIWSHLRGEIKVTEVMISDLTQDIWSILVTK